MSEARSGGLARGCHRAALLLLAVGMLTILAMWPFTGLRSTYGAWVGAPDWRMALPLGLFVALATLSRGRWRPVGRLAASVSLFWLWSSYRVLTMGDGHWWRKATSEGTVGYAEPLSSQLQAVLFRLWGAPALEWLPPIMGLIATYVWLAVTDRLQPVARPAGDFARLVAALLWIGSGVCTVFFHRYVEQTQLGIPLLLLGLANLTRWSSAVVRAPLPRAVSSRDLHLGAFLLTIAAASHLQYSGMLVAALGAAWLVGLQQGVWPSCRHLLSLTAIVAIGIGVTAALFRWGPFHAVLGSVVGGADGLWLTPLVDAQGSWFGPDSLLGAQHLALVAFVLVFAAPMGLVFAWRVVWRAGAEAGSGTTLVASSAALAYLAWVSFFGFDLGWPTDADLMLSMSPALSWLVATWLLPSLGPAKRVRSLLLVVVMFALACSAWAIITPLVRPMGTRLSQSNSPAATLSINGIGVGVGPFRVAVRPGETVALRASGPPGATFWIVKGLPNPACEGHPYGGVADIEFAQFTAECFVHAGTFDATGQAEAQWVVQPLDDGTLPGVQMIVFERSGKAKNATSAAFYFEER